LSIGLVATARNLNARRTTVSAMKEVFLVMKSANAKTVKMWVLNVEIIKITITIKRSRRLSRAWLPPQILLLWTIIA
jgi:hypothetical protein